MTHTRAILISALIAAAVVIAFGRVSALKSLATPSA
jgi:hypothetical protein